MRVAFRIVSILSVLLAILGTAGASAESDDFEGVIEPSEVVDVSSQIPGILEEVSAERGERVVQGQIIARLKSGVETASVELAQARLEFGRRKALRNEELFKKKLISSHEKDELETEIQLNELQLREESERLKLRTILSPIEGVVVKRHLSAGEFAGEKPMVTLARIDPLHVEVIVPIAKLGAVRKGMRAEVRPESPVGGTYSGKVIVIDQVADAASGTFGVRLELPNPNGKLPAGLKCRVRFSGN